MPGCAGWRGCTSPIGLDQCQRDVGLIIEDIVGPLGLTASDKLAANDDAALGEADLLADLRHHIPSRLPQSWRDELGADVTFAEASLVHDGHSIPSFDRLMCSPPVLAAASCGQIWQIAQWAGSIAPRNALPLQ